MMRFAILAFGLLVVGCATVGSMRGGKPSDVIVSSHSASDLTACIIARWDDSTFTLQSSVRPLQGGGSSITIANGLGGTALLVDVRDTEKGSRIEVFTSIHYVGPFVSDVRKCAM